ncbi:hypothetical protein SDC9_114514 [bioreactor metagenome]|uniref:Uncharacterized protein n=1 Tax=bioreactor metagenome TaxID=1076179 RepID=A0A645BQ69_9ZZZZ
MQLHAESAHLVARRERIQSRHIKGGMASPIGRQDGLHAGRLCRHEAHERYGRNGDLYGTEQKVWKKDQFLQ